MRTYETIKDLYYKRADTEKLSKLFARVKKWLTVVWVVNVKHVTSFSLTFHT
jgi:hypothetical protein